MNKNEGFTLIELMVVVAIIGILTATAIMAYSGQQKRAAQTEARTNLMNLRLLEEQFFADNGRYTVSLGVAAKDNPGNVAIIRTGNGVPTEALSRFTPGNTLYFSYWIEQNIDINGAPLTPCFRASAMGDTGTRVADDLYHIDCNNNRDF